MGKLLYYLFLYNNAYFGQIKMVVEHFSLTNLLLANVGLSDGFASGEDGSVCSSPSVLRQ